MRGANNVKFNEYLWDAIKMTHSFYSMGMTNEWFVFNQLNIHSKPNESDANDDDSGHQHRRRHTNIYFSYAVCWWLTICLINCNQTSYFHINKYTHRKRWWTCSPCFYFSFCDGKAYRVVVHCATRNFSPHLQNRIFRQQEIRAV